MMKIVQGVRKPLNPQMSPFCEQLVIFTFSPARKKRTKEKKH